MGRRCALGEEVNAIKTLNQFFKTHSSFRTVSQWNGNHQTFANLNVFFACQSFPKGKTTLYYNGLPVHFAFEPRPERPLVVLFQGAKSSNINPPYLTNPEFTSGLDCSTLRISDPGLYLSNELNLAWYAGSQFQPRFQRLLDVLVNFAIESTSADQLIFMGGCGGGFAAALAASQIKGSTAIVWNPQTDIERYNEIHVDNYFDQAWGGDRAIAKEIITTSLLNESILQSTFNLLYFQSQTDAWHVRDHFEPFLTYVAGSDLRLDVLKADWGNGHIPPPVELIRSTLKATIEEEDLPNFDGKKFTRVN